MPYNPLWGVGKDSRATISPIVTNLGTQVRNFETTTTTITNTLTNQRILFIYVNLSMKQDLSGTATGQFFRIFVDSKLIASYAPSSSNQTDWQAVDIIPVDIEAVNSSIRQEFALTSETGDYGVVARIEVYGVAID